jgi:high affinity choline transporter 7
MLVAFGLIFETLTGTPLIVGIVGGALVIFVYTAVGGLWAVALTDFLQMVILVVGLIMLLIVVLTDVGGWSAIGPRKHG